MPFLIAPQPLMITDSYELKTSFTKEAHKYRDEVIKEFTQVDISSRKSISKGGFQSVDYYSWGASLDAYLITAFVFAKEDRLKTEKKDSLGTTKKDHYLKVSTLIRQEDCVHLSSSWEKNGDKNFLPEITDNKISVSNGLSVKFDEVSPVKLENFFSTRAQEKDEFIYDLLLSNLFTQKKVPVVSTLGRIICQWKIPELKNSNLVKSGYPSRAHRIILSSFQESLETKGVKYRIQMKSGLFDTNDETFLSQEKFAEFNPQDIANKIVEKSLPTLHKLNENNFKIIARSGSWIYLNRGRAFGLSIGTRLQGPDGAKLHIIKYAPNYKGELDVSIAFLRHEKKETPLKLGDSIEIDKSKYPVLKE